MYPMNLSEVFTTQADIRHRAEIEKMAAFVARGGFWTQEVLADYAARHNLERISPLIQISRFIEDDSSPVLYVHDGHHRAIGTVLGGRFFLREDEYVVTDWTYDKYLELNPAKGWFTPFDPRSHLRFADFGAFKTEAKHVFETAPATLPAWIEANAHRYRCDRGEITTIPVLAASLSLFPTWSQLTS